MQKTHLRVVTSSRGTGCARYGLCDYGSVWGTGWVRYTGCVRYGLGEYSWIIDSSVSFIDGLESLVRNHDSENHCSENELRFLLSSIRITD